MAHAPCWHVPPDAHVAREPCGAPSAGMQLPTWPVTSQASHWPAQAVSQQTPSMQWPLAQESSEEQAVPGATFPEHEPATQFAPAAQSPLPLHEVAQASPAQA